MTSRKHLLVDDVRGRRVSAYYQEGRRRFGMPDYRQLDAHCCGFVAALTVVHYFDPDVPPRDVLHAVRPAGDSGCGQRRVIAALRRFGIRAVYRDRLGPHRLRRLVECGTPVIVTVWIDELETDHWTVLRDIDLDGDRVFLTNHGPQRGMRWADFAAIWWPRGGGLVCRDEG